MQTVGIQLDNENLRKIHPTVFMFADGSEAMELKTEVCNDHDQPVRGQWLLAIESSDKVHRQLVFSKSVHGHITYVECMSLSNTQNTDLTICTTYYSFADNYMHIHILCS